MSNLQKKKAKFDIAYALKILCMVAMLAFLACQLFLDFWTFDTISEKEKRAMVIYGKHAEPKPKTISIAEYVWFPEKNEDLFGDPEKSADKLVHNYWDETEIKQNDIVMMPFVSTLLILFTFVFFLLNKKSVWPAVMALGAGVYALYAFIVDPANVYHPFKGMGNTGNAFQPKMQPFEAGITYNIQLIASGVLTAVAFAVVVVWVIRVIRWFTVKKIHY